MNCKIIIIIIIILTTVLYIIIGLSEKKKENDPHSLFASTPSCKFSSPTGVSLEAGKLVLSVEAAATSAGPFFEG